MLQSWTKLISEIFDQFAKRTSPKPLPIPKWLWKPMIVPGPYVNKSTTLIWRGGEGWEG